MTVSVFIVPEVPRTAAADELKPRVFADFSRFPTGNQVVIDLEIRPAAFTNLSTFGADNRLTTGDEFDILPSTFSNESTFGPDNQVAEAPADGAIFPASFTNDSTFGANNEVAVAPADGTIRPDGFTNASTFGNNVVSPVETDQSYGPIDYGPIAGSPI